MMKMQARTRADHSSGGLGLGEDMAVDGRIVIWLQCGRFKMRGGAGGGGRWGRCCAEGNRAGRAGRSKGQHTLLQPRVRDEDGTGSKNSKTRDKTSAEREVYHKAFA